MLQRRHFNALGLSAFALPAGVFTAASAQAASIGQPAPDFTLTDTAGKAVYYRDSDNESQCMELLTTLGARPASMSSAICASKAWVCSTVCA